MIAAALSAVLPRLAHRPAPVVRTLARDARTAHVSGAIHVHSDASDDARGSIAAIATAARRAGLDFVVVTDHNAEDSIVPAHYRDGVLVIRGLEKSTDAGHALVLGLEHLPFRLDGDPAAVIRDAADLGGFVVAAHPASSHPERRWRAGYRGVAGMEVISLGDHDTWGGGLPALLAIPRYAFDPQGALLSRLRTPPAGLDAFDRHRREAPIAALLGSDAHGGVPSHRQMFALARQHLRLDAPLTGDPRRDAAAVLAAVRHGHGYAAIDALADASGFVFDGASGGRRAGMGGALALEDGAELSAAVDAPAGTTLVLKRDGVEVARGASLRHVTSEPGSYRVEAYLMNPDPAAPPRPWIVSNPIDVFPHAALAARTARRDDVPPLDPDLPPGRRALDTFDAPLARSWRLDHSPDAGAAARLDDGALRFDLRLGRGRTHASLASFQARDLTGAQALTFRIRSDRRFRLDVQVRTADDAAPAGVRVFRRSVRADPEWRETGVLLDALTSYDPQAGRPDFSRVTGIYFHVEPAHLTAGSAATVWIDDLAVAP